MTSARRWTAIVCLAAALGVIPGIAAGQAVGDAGRGRAVFEAKGCIRCHLPRAEGSGMGPALEAIRRPQGALEVVATVSYGRQRLPHVRHVAEFGAVCTSCHSAEMHKAVTAQPATCLGCHHSPQNERCQGCHPAQRAFYQGELSTTLAKAEPNVMAAAVGCTGCHDLSRKHSRRAVTEKCVGCHDAAYASFATEWTTGLDRAGRRDRPGPDTGRGRPRPRPRSRTQGAGGRGAAPGSPRRGGPGPESPGGAQPGRRRGASPGRAPEGRRGRGAGRPAVSGARARPTSPFSRYRPG